MVSNAVFILPLGGMILSCGVLWIFWAILQRRSGPLLERLDEEFKSILDDSHLDEEVQGLIDKRLDDVIMAFKVQIPMAAMFIGKARENSLKEVAMKELLNLIPSVKDKIKDKVVVGDKAKEIIQTYLSSARWQQFCLAGLLGLAFGFLEAIILMYF